MPSPARLLGTVLLLGLGVALRGAEGPRFYVAPNGSDQWSGRLADPAADRKDGPFATLERAREAVRASDRSLGITVTLRGGTYSRTTALRLDAADSGLPSAPVFWQAAAGERPVLSGAVTLAVFDRVTDEAIRQRLPAAVRDRVLRIDLRALGLTSFPGFDPRGSPGLELFFHGQRLPLARYPNEGWLLTGPVPQTGLRRFHEGLDREKRFDGIPAGRHYGRVKLTDPRPAQWAPDANRYAHGFWTWDWFDAFQRVESIDAANQELIFAEPHHQYGYTQNQRFYFLNVLEELDRPGEWYLDRAHGVAYVYPPEPIHAGALEASVLAEPFIQLDGASYVCLGGLGFEAGQAGGVVIRGGQACRVVGSSFRNLGALAVEIDGGTGHEIRSCDFSELARGAIRVSAGDRPTLAPGGHRIVNNHIHHFMRWLKTGQAGIHIEGVGQYVAHNLIHDTPFEAIQVRGNDHVIEYNEIHHVTQETGDAGAIYTGRDWTYRGNVIRSNYLHDLKGPGLHGGTAIYLDDNCSGFLVTGNVFVRAGRAIQVGGGRDNHVIGNVFIGCEPAVHIDARGLGWAAKNFNGQDTVLFDRFHAMHADRPPYSVRYPELGRLLAEQPAEPRGTRVIGNISWGGRWLDVYDYFAFDFRSCVELRGNVIADPLLWRRLAQNDGKPDPYFLNIDRQEGYVMIRQGDPTAAQELAGNRLQEKPPAKLDERTLVFSARDEARLRQDGFPGIPAARIGLQTDEWRRKVPARVAAR
ncbi:right-handed parallel beta-helix repeat-containing protein [Opitutus sp. ER46]|uniref:right-handed parallel beta-helix repeat-containing protein n=1 Tax=Opitutus sp. ER46 TaxID=2161864 RepID=UPI000D4C1368|nr:right-handed parallel beta-helix repeat-containing protein [Opitutus sp. ER46]PTX94465.1 hypothetical protein DB354_12025 [Opitutus sp. ER46]